MFLQLLIIQVVTLLVLFLVLRQLFHKQLNAALKRLKRLHEQNLAREEELKKEAEAARLEREEKFRRMNEESERVIQDARVRGERIVAEMKVAAREKSGQDSARVQEEQERRDRELAARHREAAVDMALAMVPAVFTGRGMAAVHEALLDELFDEIRRMPRDAFEGLASGAEVLAARPLGEARRRELGVILEEKAGVAVAFQAAEDPAMLSGFILRTPVLTIDGSLKSRLEKAAAHLKK